MATANRETAEGAMQDQMEQVLHLMELRTSGKATNTDVEAAVASVLSTAAGNEGTANNNAAAVKQSDPVKEEVKNDDENEIIPDEENYDDDENDDDNSQPAPPAPPAKRPRGRPRKHPQSFSQKELQQRKALYESIPLGWQGAQMMTTFGDGRTPRPDAVQATLLGARRKLQVAICDCRYLRRKQRQAFVGARDMLADYTARSRKGGETVGQYSSDVLYRVMDSKRRDPLSKTRIDFDEDQLQQLFPEEMNAYNHWSEMHEAYEENGGETSDSNAKPSENEEATGGHMHERLEQFDKRTDRMKQEWYMKFSDLRKGSFLPKTRGRGKKQRQQDEAAVEAAEAGEDTRIAKSGWTELDRVAVRFLHWVGFDPLSALQPPTSSTTQALAFLAHDFFGRIVEKAIFLRNLQKGDGKADDDVDETSKSMKELKEGEHLEEEDILRAMEDPDIKPIPLFSLPDKKAQSGPQLYFGPGFEHRLELELDEFVLKSAAAAQSSPGKQEPDQALCDEDLKMRREEHALFASLSNATPAGEETGTSLLDLEDIEGPDEDPDDEDDGAGDEYDGPPVAKKAKLG